MRTILGLAMAAGAALAAAPLSAGAEPTAAQHLAPVPLTVRTATRTLRFRVEVARTPAEQEIGLMFRKRVGPRNGMIFPMDPPRPASFWMKNTYVPLDILFIRADHTVSSIAANAPPLTLSPTIDSTGPVAAVLELAGGEAKRDGIRPGDTVRW